MVCSNAPLTEQHTSFMFLTFYWQDHDCSCCKFTFSHDFFNQWSFMSFLYLANDTNELFKKKSSLATTQIKQLIYCFICGGFRTRPNEPKTRFWGLGPQTHSLPIDVSPVVTDL